MHTEFKFENVAPQHTNELKTPSLPVFHLPELPPWFSALTPTLGNRCQKWLSRAMGEGKKLAVSLWDVPPQKLKNWLNNSHTDRLIRYGEKLYWQLEQAREQNLQKPPNTCFSRSVVFFTTTKEGAYALAQLRRLYPQIGTNEKPTLMFTGCDFIYWELRVAHTPGFYWHTHFAQRYCELHNALLTLLPPAYPSSPYTQDSPGTLSLEDFTKDGLLHQNHKAHPSTTEAKIRIRPFKNRKKDPYHAQSRDWCAPAKFSPEIFFHTPLPQRQTCELIFGANHLHALPLSHLATLLKHSESALRHAISSSTQFKNTSLRQALLDHLHTEKRKYQVEPPPILTPSPTPNEDKLDRIIALLEQILAKPSS